MLFDQLRVLVRLYCRELAVLSRSFSTRRIGLTLRAFCHRVKEEGEERRGKEHVFISTENLLNKKNYFGWPLKPLKGIPFHCL